MDDSLQEKSATRSLPRFVFDLLLAILFVLSVYLSASLFDWNAQWVRWADTFEIYGLGQLPIGLAAAAFAFGWYAWRRLRDSDRANRRWAGAIAELRREVAQREQAEAAERKARHSLERNLKAQRRRMHNIGLLREMGEYVLSAKSRMEILDIAARYLARILPFGSGIILLQRGDRPFLKPVKSWGLIKLKQEPELAAEACWALRRNKVFDEEPSEVMGLCGHLPEQDHAGVLCVPIICRTQQYGVLHFRYGGRYDDEDWLDKRTSERKEIRELASALGETLGLYLSNHGLRQKLARESSRDPLTGLLNRRGLEKAVHRELHQHQGEEFDLTLIMLDVDHFKRFNDTHGHDAGDLVLTALADLLSKHVRARDILCRYGGEEFMIVMPDSRMEAVTPHLEQIRRQVPEMRLEFEGKPLERVSISLGMAAWHKDAADWEELVRCADTALYAAKQQGRNRLVRYRPDMASEG
jgi:diguanylate cyclase (GGDEF)-like protein